MRVLGVVGSPRVNGNTHLLVRAALAGATSAGGRAQTVLLGKRTIRECDGCHACWKGRPCSKDDDMIALYRQIAAAEALIFGTPVYWYGPTALMKAFVDRFVYFNCPANRPKVAGKRAAIVVPFEEQNPAAADLVVAFFERSLRYLQMELVGRLIAPGVRCRGEVADRPGLLEEARALGRRLVAC